MHAISASQTAAAVSGFFSTAEQIVWHRRFAAMNLQHHWCRPQRPALAPGARALQRAVPSVAAPATSPPRRRRQAGGQRAGGAAGPFRLRAAAGGQQGATAELEPVRDRRKSLGFVEAPELLWRPASRPLVSCKHAVPFGRPAPTRNTRAMLSPADRGAGWLLCGRDCRRAAAAGPNWRRRGAAGDGDEPEGGRARSCRCLHVHRHACIGRLQVHACLGCGGVRLASCTMLHRMVVPRRSS